MKKNKAFGALTLGGLGCRRPKLAVSTPVVIRSAAKWEKNKEVRRSGPRGKNISSWRGSKVPGTVVVDVPPVCCTPPGIGSASDVAPRDKVNANAINQTSRHVRGRVRQEIRQSRQSHYPRGTPQIVMFSHDPLHPRSFEMKDRFENWRLDVDGMSYEQLLELGERIGYVYTGLKEEEIVNNSMLDSVPPPTTTAKDFRCSICLEEWTADKDVGRLVCGHLYHKDCIKKWLLQKNTCPVCKTAAISARRPKDD